MNSAALLPPPSASPREKWARRARALVVVGLLAGGVWLSLPRGRPLESPRDLAFARRFLVATHSSFAPRSAAPDLTLTGDAYRVAPGRALYLDRADLPGLFSARFAAAAPAGADLEVVAVGTDASTVVLRRELRPALRQSDHQPFFLLLDPRSFPSGTLRVGLRTAAASPGAVDWRELTPRAEADFPLRRVLPFPFVAFNGFQPPDFPGDEAHVHAPSELVLLAPAGRHTLEFVFGYNPAALAQSNFFTDGASFTVTQEGATSALLARHLTPMAQPDDRLAQSASLALSLPRPTLLRFSADPGPEGNISFDWLRWGRFQARPANPAP